MTRCWQSASLPRSTENNERGPERRRSLTPTTPLTWDAGGQNQASGTVVIPELETDNQSSTGPEAKAGRDQRAANRARVESEARAKRGPRAVSVREVGNMKDTNPVSWGLGRQTESGRCPIGR